MQPASYGKLSNLLANLLDYFTARDVKAVGRRPHSVSQDPYFTTVSYYCGSNDHFSSWHCRLTAITQLVHHGMIFVPIGYTIGAGMLEMERVKGGSPYGTGTHAGIDGSRRPSDLELQQAFHQGEYIASITKTPVQFFQ